MSAGGEGAGPRGRGPAGPAPLAPFEGPVRHVYVHVPFCRAKCDYCEFASEPVAAAAGGRAGAEAARRLDEYVDGIAAEWERERAAHDVRRLHTLYLGGGTPSLLGPERLERLLELFRPSLTPHAEVTVETNPEDVDEAYAAWAAGSGVRISLGAQSFSPGLRAVLGRTAQADPAAAFRRLRGAGVANAGIDLIHGIPGQSPELLGADIAAVLDLRPDHVSWYELDVIEGTALAARLTDAAAAGAAVPGQAAPGSGGGRPRCRGHAGRPDGRRARGRLPAHRPGALARRLRLVRGQQLRPAGAAGAPQRGVLARPALSRPRSGRREHRRRPPLDRRRRPRRLGGGTRRRRATAAHPTRRSTARRSPASACCSRPAAASASRSPRWPPSSTRPSPPASRRLDWFPCTVVQSA